MHRSRCGDSRAGIFRRIPLRGRLCTVALNVGFPSPPPPCRAPAIGVGSAGARSLDFPPLSLLISCLGKAVSVRVRVRDTVPGCELHLHFFFFPPPFSSFTPVPGMCPHVPLSSASAPLSAHARPFSSDPLSRPQCVPILSFPVSTIPTPVVIILVALCVAFGSLCFPACVVLFRVFAFFFLVLCCCCFFVLFFGLVCVACSCRATSSPA